MKLGIVIATNDAESCWNALRFANVAMKQKDQVRVFLIGKGVEFEKVSTDKFNSIDQATALNRGTRRPPRSVLSPA